MPTIEGFTEEWREATGRVQEATAQVESHAKRVDEKLGGLSNRLTATLEKLEKDAKDRVESFVEAESLKTITAEPIVFWEQKRTDHNWWFVRWIYSLVGFGIVSLGLIAALWYGMYHDDDSLTPWKIGFTLLSGSIVLMTLRVLTRMVMSSYHLMNDAQERIVMMQVYIGLAEQNRLNESNRVLILQALFRPSTTGLVKEDAVPGSMLDLTTRMSQGAVKSSSAN